VKQRLVVARYATRGQGEIMAADAHALTEAEWIERHGKNVEETMSAVLRKLVCERAAEPIKRIRELLYNTELFSDKKPPEGVDHQGQCSRNIVEATSASLPDSMAGAEAAQDGDRGLPRPPLLSIPADSSPRDAKGASLDALLALESLVTKQKEGTPGKAAAAPAKVYIPLHRRRKSREQTIVGEDPMALMDDDLERAFVQMDTNGDGAINPLELKAAFEAAGRPATDDMIRDAFAILDADEDELITLREFKVLAWHVALARKDPMKG